MPKNAQWSELFASPEERGSVKIRGVPNGTRIVVVSDCQIPLEDRALLGTVFGEFVRWFKPKTPGAEYHLFLNGDVIDNYTLSKFLDRALPTFHVGDEIKLTKKNLALWGRPFTHKHLVFGNHEDRWERYLWEGAPELAPYAPSLATVLGLAELGFDWVPYLRHYDFEGFIITHGDRTTKFVAKDMLELYHTAGTSGHVNRPQSYTYASAANGEPITWYVTGMTCRTDIGDIIKQWRRIQPWQQAFLIGEVVDGVLHVELVRIHHGGFWAAGKMFRVKETDGTED